VTELYFGFVLLLLLAVVLALRTLSVRGALVPANETRREKNVELYRLHLTDLEEQHRREEIDDAQLAELKEDLQRNLLAEVPEGKESLEATVQGRGLLWVVVLLVPVLAIPLYLHVGANDELQLAQWIEEKELLQRRGEEVPDELHQKLERALEQQVAADPDNLDYRVTAARLALESGRPAQAEEHYQAVLQVLPDNPMLLLEWAQARFAAHSSVDERVRDALQTVLRADPMNQVALELMGIHAFETGQFEQAMHYWGIGLRQSATYPERAQALWHGIQQARARLGEDAVQRVETRIELDEAFVVGPETSLFVVVRRAGAPMPVLAQRRQVSELPLEIAFDNSMSMLPGNMLEPTGRWEVVARISHQGTATPAPGDLEGISEPFSLPLQEPVELVIDTRRP